MKILIVSVLLLGAFTIATGYENDFYDYDLYFPEVEEEDLEPFVNYRFKRSDNFGGDHPVFFSEPQIEENPSRPLVQIEERPRPDFQIEERPRPDFQIEERPRPDFQIEERPRPDFQIEENPAQNLIQIEERPSPTIQIEENPQKGVAVHPLIYVPERPNRPLFQIEEKPITRQRRSAAHGPQSGVAVNPLIYVPQRPNRPLFQIEERPRPEFQIEEYPQGGSPFRPLPYVPERPNRPLFQIEERPYFRQKRSADPEPQNAIAAVHPRLYLPGRPNGRPSTGNNFNQNFRTLPAGRIRFGNGGYVPY